MIFVAIAFTSFADMDPGERLSLHNEKSQLEHYLQAVESKKLRLRELCAQLGEVCCCEPAILRTTRTQGDRSQFVFEYFSGGDMVLRLSKTPNFFVFVRFTGVSLRWRGRNFQNHNYDQDQM